MSENRVLTGKASIDRPWMKYYPAEVAQMQVPPCTVTQFLQACCPKQDANVIHYYGTDITWGEFWAQVDAAARGLKALGLGENDQIPIFMRSVPEFLMLFMAAEKIGASVLCRDNTIEENVEAVRKSGAKVIIAGDYLSQDELDAYLSGSDCEKCVLISPWRLADRDQMPDYVINVLEGMYPEQCAAGPATMDWDQFIAAGRAYTGPVEAAVDLKRPLFRVYTSGSTGPSKQVIHNASTVLGVLAQMTQTLPGGFQPVWLQTILPPALIAVVVAMQLLPMASGMLLIMDPFCDVMDLDLEMMRYRPNIWPLIPMFMERVMRSERIPADFDMSFLFSCGVGAENFNNCQQIRAAKFFADHNCPAVCTDCWGQSEAGSTITMPCPDFANYPMRGGIVGIPVPLNIVSVFKPGTQEELGYNEPGELCVVGPGVMMGYDDEESTAKALQMHADGNLWLHTGDIGYMTEDGVVFVQTRGKSPRFGGGDLQVTTMENRLADAMIPGVDDEFFVVAKDAEHEGCFLPYLYLILEEGYRLEDVVDAANAAMKEYERPVAIMQLPERPFFHFKTNRIGLSKTL